MLVIRSDGHMVGKVVETDLINLDSSKLTQMSSDGDATIGPTQDIPGYPGLTPIGLAFVLCFIGSFCNGLGAMLPFVLKNATNYKILSFMLALSAGMLGYLSFVELFAEAREFFENITDLPLLFTSLSFLSGGFLCVGLEYLSHFLVHKYGSGDEGVDLLVGNSSQDEANQNEKVEQRMEMQESTRSIQRELKKVSWFSLITISVHNVPEGIAVFFSTLANPAFGILVAFAFAVHSLMEGVIVSMPFYYATNNKRKAMLYGALRYFMINVVELHSRWGQLLGTQSMPDLLEKSPRNNWKVMQFLLTCMR